MRLRKIGIFLKIWYHRRMSEKESKQNGVIWTLVKIVALAIVSSLGFQNCGSPGSMGSASTTGSMSLGSEGGPNMTGTWSLQRLDCYDGSMTKITNKANYANLTDVLVINGNKITENITQGSCSISQSAEVVFGMTTMTLANQVVTKASNNSCLVTSTLSNSNVKPSVSATTYSTNENVLPAIRNFYYIYASSPSVKQLSIASNYSDVSRGYCFNVYYKQ